jgi:hypothetical protein
MVLVGASLANCAPSRQRHATSNDQAQVPLTAPEIETKIAGNSLYRSESKASGPWEYVGYHRPDGIMLGRSWGAGGRETADGVWEVTKKNEYCRQWRNKWGNGEYGCFQVYQNGEKLVFDQTSGSNGGVQQHTFTVMQGNPYSL